jgi:hypothetical protein
LSGSRGRLQFLGLALVFLLPLFSAFYLYYGSSYRPADSVAHGTLFSPARPLPAAMLASTSGAVVASEAFAGRWTLLLRAPGSCPADCRELLAALSQARALLGPDAARVERVLLYAGECCASDAPEAPDLRVLYAGGTGGALLALLPADDPVFLVDPHANLVMAYRGPVELPGILKDLKRLLSLSHIG